MTPHPLELQPPPQALADRVVDATRRRRWALAVAALVVGLVCGLAVVVAVAAAGERPASPALAARAAPAVATQPAPVEIYAAAVAAERGVVHVADALPASARRALLERFGGRVRFGLALPPGTGRSAVVVLRGLRVHGAAAELSRDRLCGALCGRGDELRFARRAGHWQLVGVDGPVWLNWSGAAVSRRPAS